MASSQDARSPKFYTFSVIAIIAAALVVSYFHFARNQEITAVREAKAIVADRGPRIEVVTTKAGPTQRSIKLLGDVRSGATTTLYSKISGYLKNAPVDKGDKVEAGQIVAEIESPELDQQYAGATWRASKAFTKKATRLRSPCCRRRPTHWSRRTMLPCWRPINPTRSYALHSRDA
jgi:hypothetical protein